ncbi:MAG: hypothetical protein JW850_15630 [Thermoflexales bacterium]|nr:hypothetical protein [Thermoflexales bacterium]
MTIMFGLQLPVVGALCTSAAYLLVALISLRKRGFSTWLDGMFILYLVLSILWSVGNALLVWRGLIPLVPQRGWEVAYGVIVILPVLLVMLTMLFFERAHVKWAAGIGGTMVVLVALVDNNVWGVQTALQTGLDVSSAEDLLHTLRWSAWGLFGAAAVVLTGWIYFQTRRPLHRNRALYWLITCILVVAGECLTLMLVTDYRQIGLVVHMLGVLLMAFTLIHYNLPSLIGLMRQSLSGTFVTLVIGGVYVLVFWLVRPLLVSPNLTLQWVVVGLLAVGLAVVVPPLRRFTQWLLDKALLAGKYDPARALREYSAAISNILDINVLVTVAIGIISEAMETRRGALLLLTKREDDVVEVNTIPGMGEIKIKEAEFAPGSPILASLNTAQTLSQYDIDFLPQYRSTSPLERVWLHDLDMELYVPICQQETLLGLITLGAKASGEPYSRQDLNVLSSLANQTTVALQNARLVADLKALNTQMGQLNEELTRINRQLEKLDTAKTDFIQIASHELRTPITQARGYADMLGDIVQSGVLSPTQALQISQGINRSTKRLEEIVTAMLDVSQIDIQALNLSRAPIAMTTVMRMSLESYQEGAKQRQQTLTVDGLAGLPPVHGDLQRLCQAFGNIIVNCIKFTPDGGSITINGREFVDVDDAGVGTHCVEIVIADTGIGIDLEDHELIFEKFYRVGSTSLHSTGTTKFMGAGPGLGLPIARGVIQAHGGRVWVESEGRDEQRCPGSRFHVVLPAAVIPQEEG